MLRWTVLTSVFFLVTRNDARLWQVVKAEPLPSRRDASHHRPAGRYTRFARSGRPGLPLQDWGQAPDEFNPGCSQRRRHVSNRENCRRRQRHSLRRRRLQPRRQARPGSRYVGRCAAHVRQRRWFVLGGSASRSRSSLSSLFADPSTVLIRSGPMSVPRIHSDIATPGAFVQPALPLATPA